MNITRKLASLTILLVCILILVQPGRAYASDRAVPNIASQNNRELFDQVVFGDTYTLRNGETMVGDLIILGGSVTLEEGSRVDGSVVLVGGSLTIGGTVEKDLVVIGGSPVLDDSGSIQGDAITIGSSLNGNRQRVAGDIFTDSDGYFNIRMFDGHFPTLGVARAPFLWDILGLFFTVFFMTAMAIGTVLILPKQSQRTAQVLIRQPVASGGMGCLTVIMAPVILLIMAITIFMLPFSVLGVLLLVLLVIFGWIALGMEIGNRLAKAIHRDWHPAVAAGAGTFGLTLVALSISRVVTYVGWMVPFLVSLIALGAVMLVFFGAGKATTIAPAVITTIPSPSQEASPSQDRPAIPDVPSDPTPSDDGIPPAI